MGKYSQVCQKAEPPGSQEMAQALIAKFPANRRMPGKQNQRRNIPSCERTDCRAYSASASAAILRSQATRVDAAGGKSGDEGSFIHKLITNAIDGQNVLRLTGFEFDLAADVLNMRIDGAFIRFKCHAVDGIQQLGTREHTAGLAGERSQ